VRILGLAQRGDGLAKRKLDKGNAGGENSLASDQWMHEFGAEGCVTGVSGSVVTSQRRYGSLEVGSFGRAKSEKTMSLLVQCVFSQLPWSWRTMEAKVTAMAKQSRWEMIVFSQCCR
jgi:hypothetical protein